MRVLVLGGYGLIGGYVVAALAAAGHEVIGAGRDIRLATIRYPQAAWRRADLARFKAKDWAPLLEGIEAIVNCAGALQDNPRDDLQSLHVSGLITLARAAPTAGVSRLVHISAAGMAGAPGDFGRTKLEAEAALAAETIAWTILRPGLVLAPAAFGGSALLRGLAGLPLVIPAVYPDSLIQVVSVEDVADAVRLALAPDAPRRVAIDLVSVEVYPLRDILMRLRAWMGFTPAPLLTLPPALATLSAKGADALAWLGWRSPMRSTAIVQLRHGVRGEANEAAVLPGLRIRSLAQILSASPSGVQERWFARLYFLKPLGLATLCLFWLTSGLGGLLRLDQAELVLTTAGFPVAPAKVAVLGGATADILLALLVCHRRTAWAALRGMIAVSSAYLAGASIWRPDLWADPLGPMIKVLPSIILALMLLAVMEER